LGLRSRYDEFNQSLFAESILTPEQLAMVNVNKLAMKVNDFTNQFYLQTLFSKDLALTLGFEHKRLKFSTETILTDNNNDEETVFEKSDYLSLFGKLKFDTYDDKYFPTKGFLFDGDFHTYIHSSDYNDNFSPFSIAKATIGFSQSISKDLTVNWTNQGGFRIGEGTNQYLSFALGGYGAHLINNYTPFLGYDFLSLNGNSFVKSTLTLDYEFVKKNHINLTINVANVEDNIFETKEWLSLPDYTGYALGYALETFIGPIEAKYSWSPETKRGFWFFNIGFWY
jgi:NTE family protein